MCCDVGQISESSTSSCCVGFVILCLFASDEAYLSAMWFIFTEYDLLSGYQLARNVLGDAHDPIDGGEDYNHTWHPPLSYHDCNPWGKEL